MWEHLAAMMSHDRRRRQTVKTFRNPIVDEQAAACCITKHKGSYYMAFTCWDRIEILKSPILSNFRDAERCEVFRPPPNMTRVLSQEIHSIQGDLYIYFSMGAGMYSQRMYVIKCVDSNNPMGEWTSATRLLEEEDLYAIHGTVLQYPNGQLYFIWASHNHSDPELAPSNSINLYIARMPHPLRAIVPRTLLRTPTMEWEKHGYPVNEAPFIIQNHGRTLLVFSASHVTSPHYCLGIMGLDGGRDPMVPSHWWDDVNRPVFFRNDIESVWAPGHACFVRSPDDSELWMVYDAWDDINDNGKNRRARIQKIEWEMNSPKFPAALGIHQDLEVPRGE